MAIRGTVWVSWSCQSECGHCQHLCLLYRRGDERRPSSRHFEYWWVWFAQVPQRYRHLGIAPCNTQVIGFGSLRAIVTAGSSSTEEALGEVRSSVTRLHTQRLTSAVRDGRAPVRHPVRADRACALRPRRGRRPDIGAVLRGRADPQFAGGNRFPSRPEAPKLQPSQHRARRSRRNRVLTSGRSERVGLPVCRSPANHSCRRSCTLRCSPTSGRRDLGLPVEVPPPGEYVADGAARQAGGVILGRLSEWQKPPQTLSTERQPLRSSNAIGP